MSVLGNDRCCTLTAIASLCRNTMPFSPPMFMSSGKDELLSFDGTPAANVSLPFP